MDPHLLEFLQIDLDTLWPDVLPGTWCEGICVLEFVTDGQDHLTWVPGNPSICATWLRSTILGPQKAVPSGSYLLWQGFLYRLMLEAPLFRRMLTGPKVFFELPGMSALQLCARLPCLKGHEPHFALVEYQINTGFISVIKEIHGIILCCFLSYLPTSPLGQDMTQGQFLQRSFNRFEFRVFLLIDL